MLNAVGSWGLYSWFREHGLDMVHPADRELFESLFPYSKLFYCEGVDGEYLILRYGTRSYRVKDNLFQIVNFSIIPFGEIVFVNKGRGILKAKVVDIQWHFQKHEPMYFVETDGKKLKKQYWASDLQVRTVQQPDAG
jgi:hypothetical protein